MPTGRCSPCCSSEPDGQQADGAGAAPLARLDPGQLAEPVPMRPVTRAMPNTAVVPVGPTLMKLCSTFAGRKMTSPTSALRTSVVPVSDATSVPEVTRMTFSNGTDSGFVSRRTGRRISPARICSSQ